MLRKVLYYLSSHHAFLYLWVAGGFIVLVMLAYSYMEAHEATPLEPEPEIVPAAVSPQPVESEGSAQTDAAAGSAFGTASLGESVVIGGVTLTPLEVLEDSRCPTGAQCVREGIARVRVRVRSALGESTTALDVGVPLTTEAEVVTLTALDPRPEAGTAPDPSSYRASFSVEPR